jgi:hypothetical protein
MLLSLSIEHCNFVSAVELAEDLSQLVHLKLLNVAGNPLCMRADHGHVLATRLPNMLSLDDHDAATCAHRTLCHRSRKRRGLSEAAGHRTIDASVLHPLLCVYSVLCSVSRPFRCSAR